jgi:hypothetical protein
VTEEAKKLSGAALGKFYTPGLQDELISLVRKGNTRGEAAKRCKLAPRTFGYWMARGTANLAEVAEAEEREPGAGYKLLDDFGVFRLEIEAALSQVQAGLKDVIFKRAMGDAPDAWKAAAWILERRFGDNWGRRGPSRTEADDSSDTGPVGEHASVAQGLTTELKATIEEQILGVPRRA